MRAVPGAPGLVHAFVLVEYAMPRQLQRRPARPDSAGRLSRLGIQRAIEILLPSRHRARCPPTTDPTSAAFRAATDTANSRLPPRRRDDRSCRRIVSAGPATTFPGEPRRECPP